MILINDLQISSRYLVIINTNIHVMTNEYILVFHLSRLYYFFILISLLL